MHYRGATTDSESLRVKKPVTPDARGTGTIAEGADATIKSSRAREIKSETHDLLPVVVGQCLSNARLRTWFAARENGRQSL